MTGPTFFGEVLPLESYIAEFDDDFETEHEPSYQTRTEPKDFCFENGSKLLLFCGPQAQAFARIAFGLSNVPPLVTIDLEPKVPESEMMLLGGYQITGYTLKSNPDLVIFFCHKEPPLDFCHHLSQEILSHLGLSPQLIFVFSSRPCALYKGSHPDTETFVRIINTDEAKNMSGINQMKKLDCPNVIEGMPAAILTHCSINDISAVSLTSYFQSISPQDFTDTVRSFMASRKIAFLKELFPTIEEFEAKLKEYKFSSPQLYA